MDKQKEEFKQWAAAVQFHSGSSVNTAEAFAAWNARQPVIDTLKSERDAHRDNAQQLVEENAALAAAPTLPAQEQATACACCLECKPTPPRIDRMGGYVCLTCINKELTKPAQEDEPVASLYVSRFRGHLENTQFEYLGDLPDGTYKLYTRPDNDKLRKAAAELLDHLHDAPLGKPPREYVEALRAELSKK